LELYFNDLSIKSQFNPCRKNAVHLFMQSDVMSRMYQIGLASPHPTSKRHGIIDKLMRMVGLVETQGFDHEQFSSLQI
jgi:hypothetical protein